LSDLEKPQSLINRGFVAFLSAKCQQNLVHDRILLEIEDYFGEEFEKVM